MLDNFEGTRIQNKQSAHILNGFWFRNWFNPARARFFHYPLKFFRHYVTQAEFRSRGDMSKPIVCDVEPIHTPEFIQSHGFLFALDLHSFDILKCSENLYILLNIDVLTMNFLDLLDELNKKEFLTQVNNLATTSYMLQPVSFYLHLNSISQVFCCSIHFSKIADTNVLIVELEFEPVKIN
jgi:hypothetical protein